MLALMMISLTFPLILLPLVAAMPAPLTNLTSKSLVGRAPNVLRDCRLDKTLCGHYVLDVYARPVNLKIPYANAIYNCDANPGATSQTITDSITTTRSTTESFGVSIGVGGGTSITGSFGVSYSQSVTNTVEKKSETSLTMEIGKGSGRQMWLGYPHLLVRVCLETGYHDPVDGHYRWYTEAWDWIPLQNGNYFQDPQTLPCPAGSTSNSKVWTWDGLDVSAAVADGPWSRPTSGAASFPCQYCDCREPDQDKVLTEGMMRAHGLYLRDN